MIMAPRRIPRITEIKGIAIAIEKAFQHGGDELRKEGYDIFSLAIIESMNEKEITFRK